MDVERDREAVHERKEGTRGGEGVKERRGDERRGSLK